MSRLWDIVKHRLVQYKRDPLTGGIDLSAGDKTIRESVGRMKRAEKYSLKAVRPVMASAPTVTPGSTLASITDHVDLVPYTDTAFTLDGRWAGHPAFGAYGYYCSDHVLATSGNMTRTSRLEFMTDAPVFAFDTAQNPYAEAQNILIWINDKLVSSSAVTYTADGAGHVTKVDLSAQTTPRGPWKVRLDSNNVAFNAVAIGPLDRVWPVSYEDTVRVGFMGDSITEGYNATQMSTSWWNTLSDLMGWKRALNFGRTSIGYINDGGSYTLGDRLASVSAFPLDVLICAGGINDWAATEQQEHDAVVAFITSAQSLMPRVKLIIVGPFAAPGQAVRDQIFDAIKAACAEKSVDYIDTKLPYPWQFGTGRVGATTGNGNSDLYISSDNVHPSQAGHDYLAQRLYQSVSGVVSAWQ